MTQSGMTGPRIGHPRSNVLTGRLQALLSEGARAWNTTPLMIGVLACLPFLVVLVGLGTALAGKETYKLFTGEDGIAETLQVILYAMALGLSFNVGRRLWLNGQRLEGLLYFLLTGGFVFLVGEELSWGQRLLGWSTPEALGAINKQQETNLHNIEGVGYTFKWIQLLVGAYGAVLPLVLPAWTSLARYRSTLSLLVPHFTLVPYFAFMFFWRLYRNLFDAPREYYFAVAEFNEVIELVLALGFFLFLVFQIGRIRARQRVVV
jgi:hypothetical protein